eukprot:scaffold3359_cov123-Cylindrotheca_fusiformis.AAC.1
MTAITDTRRMQPSDKTTALWEKVSPMVQGNNIAVSLIQEGRYTEAQLLLSSVLFELQDQVEDSSIMMNSFLQVPDSSTTTNCDSNSRLSVDDWMSHSQTDQENERTQFNDTKDTNETSFHLYDQAISIPTILNDVYDSAFFYKCISFTVFFNQGLTHHLASLKPSMMGVDEENNRRTLASTAHQLYRLALQYRYESQSVESKFLLAVCNNLAVLDYQWNPPKPSNNLTPYFEYLRMLLGNPVQLSTPGIAALRNRCWGNILLVMGWFPTRCQHAASA